MYSATLMLLGSDTEEAVERAKAAAARVQIRYWAGGETMRTRSIGLLAALALSACNNEQQAQNNMRPIKVRAYEQEQLHKLDAFNLAIGLKRAIYDAGFSCKRVSDAGFVGSWQNLDMWMARCTDGKLTRDWAIFAGPDGSAQVRDCRDVPGSGLPPCVIKERPKGSFSEAK